MELARQDLGDEALLVHARPATPEQLHLGDYEVVFGVVDTESAVELTGNMTGTAEPEPFDTASAGTSAKRWTPPIHDVPVEAEVSKNPPETALPVSDLASSLPAGQEFQQQDDRHHSGQQHESSSLPEIGELEEGDELDAQFAELRRAVYALAARISDERNPKGNARILATGSPTLDPTLGVPGAARKIVAVVGPSGAGKTTTLIKLAVKQGLAEGRSVQLINTDLHRVGAASRLKSMASVLGIACRPAPSADALEQILEDAYGVDLLLVDTPPELTEIPGLAARLAQHSEIDTHLVLPASMSSEALTAAAEAYSGCQPGKLILTKLDELHEEPHLPQEFLRAYSCASLPVSFFAAGSRIPDDLESANEAWLTESANAKPTEMRATA